MRTRLANVLLSLVIAAVAAAGIAYWMKTSREADVAAYTAAEREGPSEPRDRVRAAIDELRADGVHVAPDARSMLDRKGEQAIEEAIAGRQVAIRVLFWRETRGGGAYLDATRQLEEAFGGERGVVIVWEGPEQGETLVTGSTGYVSFNSSDFVGDPVTTITGVLDEIELGTDWENRPVDSDYWGGIGGGFAAGLLIGGLGLLGLGILLLVLRGVSRGLLRLPGKW